MHEIMQNFIAAGFSVSATAAILRIGHKQYERESARLKRALNERHRGLDEEAKRVALTDRPEEEN